MQSKWIAEPFHLDTTQAEWGRAPGQGFALIFWKADARGYSGPAPLQHSDRSV